MAVCAKSRGSDGGFVVALVAATKRVYYDAI
jgi:hypothetical protein